MLPMPIPVSYTHLPRLDHIQNDLLNNFHRLGVQAKPLNGAQRLKLMHDMFNMDCLLYTSPMTETKQTSTTKTDRRPYWVTEIRMGNSGLIVSGFFKQGATDTAADKMRKVLEAEAATQKTAI